MYVLTLLTVLAVPACGADGWCAHGWYGAGGYAHGYGSFWPVITDRGGVGLLPSWPCDPTPWCDHKAWNDYVMQLEGEERDDMIRVWMMATPCARKRLLEKLPPMIVAAANYRDQVARERALERYRIENRPMSEEEVEVFENYYGRLRGAARKDARYRWLNTDNRGRRLYLKDVLKQEEIKELQREDQKDDEDEAEIQKEKAKKAKQDKAKQDKAKQDKEEKDKDEGK